MKAPESLEEEGQKNHFDYLKTHLFFPQDVEGRKNEDYLSFLRTLDEKFLRMVDETDVESGFNETVGIKKYAGLIPFSSMMKGYGNDDSDFDVVVLGCNDTSDSISFMERIVEIHASAFGREGHVGLVFSDSYFERNLQIHNDEPEQNDAYCRVIYQLAFPIIGKMDVINYWRKLAIKKHKLIVDTNPERAQSNINDAVEFALDADIRGRKERIINRGVSEKQYEEILEARRGLWKKRITDMLEGKGAFSYLNDEEIREGEDELQLESKRA